MAKAPEHARRGALLAETAVSLAAAASAASSAVADAAGGAGAGAAGPGAAGKASGKGAGSDEAGKKVAKKTSAASAPVAPVAAQEVEAAARETLLGTIAAWGDAGVAEIERVSGLLGEHVLGAEEAARVTDALERIAAAAAGAQSSLRLADALGDLLSRHGLSPASVLVFDERSGTLVTRSGRKIGP